MSKTLADLVVKLSHPVPEIHQVIARLQGPPEILRVLTKLAGEVPLGSPVIPPAPVVPGTTVPPPAPVANPVATTPATAATTAPPVAQPKQVSTPAATPAPVVKAPPSAPAAPAAWDGKTMDLRSAVKYPDAAAAYQKTLQAPLPANATQQDYLARGKALSAAQSTGLYGTDLQPFGEAAQKGYLATPGATPEAWGENSALGVKDSVAARGDYGSVEEMQAGLAKARAVAGVPPEITAALKLPTNPDGTLNLINMTPEQRTGLVGRVNEEVMAGRMAANAGAMVTNAAETVKGAVQDPAGAAQGALDWMGQKLGITDAPQGEPAAPQLTPEQQQVEAASVKAQELTDGVAKLNKAGPDLHQAIAVLNAGTPELKQYVKEVSEQAGKDTLLQTKAFVEAGDKEGIMETIMRNPAALLVPAGLMLAMFGGDTGKILGVLAMAGGGFNLYQQYQGASTRGGPVVSAMASLGLRDYTAKGINEFLASPQAAQHNFTPDMAHDALNSVLLLNHGSQEMVASAGAAAGQRAAAWQFPDATQQAQQLAAR